jgi:spore coat protein CotH
MNNNRLLLLLLFFSTLISCSRSVTDDDTPLVEEEVIEISEFYFAKEKNPTLSADLILEEDNGLYTGELPKYHSKNLIPTFKTNASKVLVNNLAQESGATARDFSQPVTYSFVGAKGAKKDVTIRLNWTSFEIPQFHINIEGGQEVVQKETYLKASLRIDGKTFYSNFEASTRIRGRGNSTWGQPKKPYRLNLDSKASILGLPEAKNWVLLANFLDPSLMCNAVAMRIGRDLQVPFTNDIIPVDVTINGTYRGSYVLTQHLEVASNRINITDNGYLFELDDYFDEDFQFRSANYNLPVMIKSPELDEQDEIAPIKTEFEQLESLIFAANFPNSGYRDKLDIDAFARYLMVYILTGNEELNHPKSTYMHKVPTGKFSFGPIWDFDWAYGFEGSGNHFSNPSQEFFWNGNKSGTRFFNRLLSDPEVKKAFKTHWESYKVNHFNNLIRFVDEYSNIIKESKARDEMIWKKGKNFDVEVVRLKNYLNSRKTYIDNMVRGY